MAAPAVPDGMASAIAAILSPTVDVASTVRAVVVLQRQLGQELEALNAKLAVAAAQNAAHATVAEKYIVRLKSCRNRVDAVNLNLVDVKSRLARVLAHMQAQTKAVDAKNRNLLGVIEASNAPTAAVAAGGGSGADAAAPAVGRSTTPPPPTATAAGGPTDYTKLLPLPAE